MKQTLKVARFIVAGCLVIAMFAGFTGCNKDYKIDGNGISVWGYANGNLSRDVAQDVCRLSAETEIAKALVAVIQVGADRFIAVHKPFDGKVAERMFVEGVTSSISKIRIYGFYRDLSVPIARDREGWRALFRLDPARTRQAIAEGLKAAKALFQEEQLRKECERFRKDIDARIAEEFE